MTRLLLAALLLPAVAAAAPKTRSGVLSTDFEGKLIGARYVGFGAQGAAAAGGPQAPVWNPATLHDLVRPTFSADFDVARHSKIDDDVLTGDLPLRGRKLTYLGFAASDAAFFFRPLASFNRRTVTDALDPANNFIDENLSVTQFGVSAASEMEQGAVVGLTLSYLMAHRSLARATTNQAPVVEFASGNGFSLDLGLSRKWPNASFGAALFNLPGILYWNNYKADQLPMKLKIGGAFYPVPAFGLLVEHEKNYYRGGLPRPNILHLGVEILAASWLQLRGGTYGDELSDAEKVNYTAGISAAAKNGYQVDIGFRRYRFQQQPVYNYFLSLVLPLPEGAAREDVQPQPSTRFRGRGLDQYR